MFADQREENRIGDQCYNSSDQPRDSKNHLTTVLLVDDDPSIRVGLTQILAEDSSIKVAGEADNGEAAVSLAITLQPDIVVMDLSMPKLDGIVATREILANTANTNVVALSVYTDMDRARDVIDAGAMGYVVKAGASRYLSAAVRAVANGNVFFSPGVSAKIFENLYSPQRSFSSNSTKANQR